MRRYPVPDKALHPAHKIQTGQQWTCSGHDEAEDRDGDAKQDLGRRDRAPSRPPTVTPDLFRGPGSQAPPLPGFPRIEVRGRPGPRNKSGRDDKGGTRRTLATPPDLADPLPTRFRPLALPNDNHVCWAKPRMADDARVRPLPLTVQAAYADLLARLQEDAVLELGGTPVLRRRGAREYWYSVQRLAGRSAERYSGPDSPEVRERVERARRVNEDLKERARQRARCPRPPAAVPRLSDPRPGAGGDPLPVGSPRQRPRSRPLRDPQAHRRDPVRALRGRRSGRPRRRHEPG